MQLNNKWYTSGKCKNSSKRHHVDKYWFQMVLDKFNIYTSIHQYETSIHRRLTISPNSSPALL